MQVEKSALVARTCPHTLQNHNVRGFDLLSFTEVIDENEENADLAPFDAGVLDLNSGVWPRLALLWTARFA